MNIQINMGGKSSWIGYVVPVGSRDESNKKKGVSHFLEHMLFKGTKNRDKLQIQRELEQYGADLNAYTGEERTVYWSKISSKYADRADAVLRDMVENSLIPEVEVNKERDIIIQEIKTYTDSPTYRAYELATQAVRFEDSNLYLPIAGTIETVKGLTQEDIYNHYQTYYQNTQRVIVGNTSEVYGNLVFSQRFSPEIISQLNAEPIIEERADISQATMILTGVFNIGDSLVDEYSIKILNGILNGFTGRLFQKVREEHNLVYQVYFYVENFSCGTCQWHVFVKLEKDKMDFAKEVILAELTRPITSDELAYAKDKILGSTELALDNNEGIGYAVAYSLIRGIDYREFIYNYQANINSAYNNFNKLLERIDFNNNRLVAIVPK